MENTALFTANNVWMMICTGLVFFMHLGFSFLEIGLTRQKNTVNILFKNFFVITIGLLLYMIGGFNLMYPGFEEGSYWADSESFNPASTTPLSFRVLAAFFVVLVSMGLVLLTQGAKGNWAVAHISLFSVTFFTLAVIIGAAVNTDQVIPAGPNEGTYTPDDSTNTSNMAVSAFVLLLNVYGYYKMREEGVEDGMTFGGKDFGNKDDFFFKMYPAVTAVYVVLLLIANYVTQPL